MASHAPTAVKYASMADADYDHVYRLIYSTVHKFRKRYRLWDRPDGEREWDLDAMMSQAHEDYARARSIYDPTRGAKFSTWVRTLVWRGLFSRMIRHGHRMARMETSAELDLRGDTTQEAPLASLLWEEMSDDARAVIELALEPCVDIKMAVQSQDTPRSRRRAIRDYCKDAFGWSLERVADTFDEIATLLQG